MKACVSRTALAIFVVVLLLGLVACAPQSEIALNQVIEAFNNAGLEAENARVMVAEDYGMAPMVAQEAMRFYIPSLGEDSGGRIFKFAAQEDLDITKTYYEELGRASAIFFSWLFVKDMILVQINGELPEEKARRYEEVLINLNPSR